MQNGYAILAAPYLNTTANTQHFNMVSLRYNPFGKPFSKVEAKDLKVLEEVAEGWYVEYKREVPSTKSVAKSVSAFANHYGGWVFYGIDEKRDGSRQAGSFPGVDTASVPSLERLIREAVAAHVSPPSQFEVGTLKGPCLEIGLPDNKSIIGVRVPLGYEAPYIHSSGKIYRRVGDASEPKPETDRSALDLLWERSRESDSRMESFLRTEPLLSKAEEETTLAQVFLLTDPSLLEHDVPDLDFDTFASIMKNDQTHVMYSLPFDNAYEMSAGYVARSVKGTKNPYFFCPTWKYYGGVNSVATFALNTYNISRNLELLYVHFDGYDHVEPFVNSLKTSGLSGGWATDLSAFLAVLIGVVAKHQELMRAEGVVGPVLAKVALHNIWRRIPFLDSSTFMSILDEHGVPVVQDDSAVVPPGIGLRSCLEFDLKEQDDEEARQGAVYSVSFNLIREVFAAMGVSGKVLKMSDLELIDMVTRYLDVSERRGARDDDGHTQYNSSVDS